MKTYLNLPDWVGFFGGLRVAINWVVKVRCWGCSGEPLANGISKYVKKVGLSSAAFLKYNFIYLKSIKFQEMNQVSTPAVLGGNIVMRTLQFFWLKAETH